MLSSESGVYKLQAQAQNNAESWIEGAAVDTLDAAQLIEVEYKAASAAGANDGYLKLWINDSLVDTISNLDNDTYLIDTTSLGVVGSLDAGTSGTVYFDAFESYKTVRSASSTSTQIETPTPTITAPETPTIFPTETAIPTQIGAIPHPAGGALFAFLPAQLGTITPVPPTGSLTITYTYDALNRLTSAVYSDGRHFNYTYDANGNTLQLERDLGPGTVTTSYIYDAANQLNTAVEGSNTWQFTYDANGSLTSNGVSSYTYDSANRLIAVDGADIDTTMSYNGLGQRLSMEAAGVTTQYVMAGNNPLTADADGNVTTYLYGLGAVAEKTTAWNYALPDGSNTPRQLTNASGAVTFATRYSPWGDTLETYGAGNFAFGYYGGVMDAATGLLYVGNGQYYDPATGRFLTRDAKSKQDNPYTPFDPMGALFAPLGLVALVYSNRKKGSKWVILLVILSFAVVTGMTLSGCGLGDDATPTETPTQPPSETPSPNGPGNDSGDTTSNPGTPTSMPETPCLPETSTSTPSNTYRLTGIDWEGTGLVQFLGNLMSESSKQAVLLALDMIQRASGKTPDGVSHWISNNGIRVYGVEGDGRIGGNSVDGSVQLNSANTTAYLSPDGLGVIIHELAHGIDVTVGKQKGYSESYSMHFYPDGSGWNVDWFKNNVGNIEFRGDLRGPANDYLRFNGVLSPTEDFATAFASVVIETNIQLGLMNFAGTTDLSPYIRLVPGGEAPAWPSFGYVNDERRALIKGILE
jgi:RHS repeat-associated protein